MKVCPKCGVRQEDEVITCDCGFNLNQSSPIVKTSHSIHAFPPTVIKGSETVVEQKYSSLRTISSYFHLLAWLNLIGAVLLAVFMIKNATVFAAFISIFGGISTFVITSAVGELIMVVIDIEENLRRIVCLNEK